MENQVKESQGVQFPGSVWYLLGLIGGMIVMKIALDRPDAPLLLIAFVYALLSLFLVGEQFGSSLDPDAWDNPLPCDLPDAAQEEEKQER